MSYPKTSISFQSYMDVARDDIADDPMAIGICLYLCVNSLETILGDMVKVNISHTSDEITFQSLEENSDKIFVKQCNDAYRIVLKNWKEHYSE